jgi:polar amino acid transport system substrate-binding protein
VRRVAAIAAGLLVVALAGCGAGSDATLHVTLAALDTAAPRSPTPAASAPTATCGNVEASLRPPAVMPRPGAMPAGSFMAAIQRQGYLLAGVDENTLLFAYYNPLHRRIEGFEIDLLRQIARAIFGNPNRVKFRAITTEQRIPVVQSGRVDIVADAMTITCARKQEVDFSTVYYDATQKILVPSDSPVRSIQDLRGQRVCVATGTTSLQTLMAYYPRVGRYTVPERTDCLVALQRGLVSAVTSDNSILLGLEAQDPYTRIVGAPLAKEPYGMAINKAHPDFVRFVNGVLAQMRADGTWRKIYTHWFGTLTAVQPPPKATYLR